MILTTWRITWEKELFAKVKGSNLSPPKWRISCTDTVQGIVTGS